LKGIVLVIEGEGRLASLLGPRLEPRGVQVPSTPDAQEALALAHRDRPGFVILDMATAGMAGWQACKQIRQMADVPIAILSSGVKQTGQIRGVVLGEDGETDAALTLEDLEAHICSAVDRAGTHVWGGSASYDDGTLRIDLERQVVSREGETTDLTPLERRLLGCLLRRPGQVVPYYELLEEMWGSAYEEDRHSLYVYVHSLRGKLEQNPRDPRYIRTEQGVGYRFAPPRGTS
jgi:two-component system KDP operon response regulator KdpE